MHFYLHWTHSNPATHGTSQSGVYRLHTTHNFTDFFIVSQDGNGTFVIDQLLLAVEGGTDEIDSPERVPDGWNMTAIEEEGGEEEEEDDDDVCSQGSEEDSDSEEDSSYEDEHRGLGPSGGQDQVDFSIKKLRKATKKLTRKVSKKIIKPGIFKRKSSK